MIELFEKYVDWKILAHFLNNPTTSFYIKELARILKVSSGSASTAVKKFELDGFLTKEQKGLAHLYKLNVEHPATSPMKRAYGVIRVLELTPIEKFFKIDENIISLALIGSYSDGSYDEKSDLDFLVITPSKEDFGELGTTLETEFGARVNITFFKLSQWRQFARRRDALYKRIVENHVLLHGSGLK